MGSILEEDVGDKDTFLQRALKSPFRRIRSRIKRYYSKDFEKIGWFTPDFSNEQFENYLYKEIVDMTNGNGSNIIFSEPNEYTASLSEKLLKRNYKIGVISGRRDERVTQRGVKQYETIAKLVESNVPVDAFIVTDPSSRKIHHYFNEIRKHRDLEDTPFIFKNRDNDTYPLLKSHDKYPDFSFITSRFDDGLFEDIYRHSLTKVPMKCQVRDAYDLFQCLSHVQNVDGDIVEFGSFQGHSGLLMAEYIRKQGLEKRLYLCDMFEGFPDEEMGIDQVWNNTHSVDFARVKSLFEPYDFVSLVKGEFERTVHDIPSEKFSLAMIDCDSFRATCFVANFIYPKLAEGGVMFFEDYGHGPCLGARAAVDEFLADKQDRVFTMFSFFSGANIVLKTSLGSHFGGNPINV